MKIYFITLGLIIGGIFYSCKTQKKSSCIYSYSQLLNDSSNLFTYYKNDTLFEIRDRVKDTSTYGVYIFDKKQTLRFYGFFVNEEQYKYSEEYDSFGNLLTTQGNPLIEYRLFKGEKDTVIFDVSLFALNKKFQKIELISNKLDTIEAAYLYKSNLYSNVKCFEFKLPVLKSISSLVLFSTLEYDDLCNSKRISLKDTASFRDVDFVNGRTKMY